MTLFDDAARVDSALDSRSISFENPRGERGRGGVAANGRQDAPFSAFALAERRDDYCAVAFVCCRSPQPVPRVDIKAAAADVALRDYEGASGPPV
jgi:hypothetical protein